MENIGAELESRAANSVSAIGSFFAASSRPAEPSGRSSTAPISLCSPRVGRFASGADRGHGPRVALHRFERGRDSRTAAAGGHGAAGRCAGPGAKNPRSRHRPAADGPDVGSEPASRPGLSRGRALPAADRVLPISPPSDGRRKRGRRKRGQAPFVRSTRRAVPAKGVCSLPRAKHPKGRSGKRCLSPLSPAAGARRCSW